MNKPNWIEANNAAHHQITLTVEPASIITEYIKPPDTGNKEVPTPPKTSRKRSTPATTPSNIIVFGFMLFTALPPPYFVIVLLSVMHWYSIKWL